MVSVLAPQRVHRVHRRGGGRLTGEFDRSRGYAVDVQRAVFLDRDNTLIANDGDLGDPADVRLLDGVADGLHRLRQAGYTLIVVTNQGGVARGAYSEADVDAVHQRIAQLAARDVGAKRLIDRFYYCPFHPEGTVEAYRREHPWRKPSPGMILQAARDMDIDLSQSWMLGDQPRDIEAGLRAGCRTIMLDPAGGLSTNDVGATAASFADAVAMILEAVPVVEVERMAATSSSKRREPARAAQGAPSAEKVQRRSASSRTEQIETGGGAHATSQDVATTEEPHAPNPPSAAAPRASTEVARTSTPGGGGRAGGGPNGRASISRDSADLELLQRSVTDLADELRSERQRKAEFTMLRMAAGLCQLLVLLCAMLALLQMSTGVAVFAQWMSGAVLLQLFTLSLLVLDSRA